MIALDPQPRPLDHLALCGAPADEALRVGSERLSYARLEEEVARLAGALATLAQAGDRVATWLPKTKLACLMPLAAARAGLIHIPVNPVLKRAQVAHILADSEARLLLTNPARAATLVAGDLPPSCALRGEDEPWPDAPPLPPSSHPPDRLAAILYTSGSTGRPKGVMLTHANLWLGAISVAHYLALEPDDVTLALLPLGFDYGQNQLFSTWTAGATAVAFDYLVPRDVVRAVAREGVTTLAGVPPLWVQLTELDWGAAGERMRRVTNSGGALTPTLIDALRRAFPGADIYPMYGLTEAFRSTYLPPALVTVRPRSIGRAIPFAEVMAVRADGSEAAPGEPGELVHAGPLVAAGYWRDPERTRERFHPAPAWSRSGGVAVWSGDKVVRDADGFFTFVGREDELIKTSGHRVSPAEIEEAAVASGHAREAIAYGVADARLGQAIRLVVSGDGDDAALRAALRRELPSHMQPGSITWEKDLPRNANGKLDRAAVRARG